MNLIFLLLDKLNALYDILQQGVSSKTHPTVISIVPTVVCLALLLLQTNRNMRENSNETIFHLIEH